MNQLRGTRTQDSQVVVTTPDGDLGLSAAVEVSPAAVPDAADPSVRGTSSRDVARGEAKSPPEPTPQGSRGATEGEPAPVLGGHRGVGSPTAIDPAGGTRSSALPSAARPARRGRPGSGQLRLAAPQSAAFDDGPEPALRLKPPEPPDEAA